MKRDARLGRANHISEIETSYPSWKKDWGVAVVPLHEQLTGAIRPQLWVLSGAVGFVLLIACANIAGLLLARMEARRREMAIRAALGAGRRRVIRQWLTESVLLSMLGGTLGLLLAAGGIRLLIQLSADSLPRVQTVGVDSAALVFAFLMSVVTGVVFGLAPALHLASPDLNAALKQAGRSPRAGSGSGLRGGLIVAEVALALMLQVGAGLMLRSLDRLTATPIGFDPENLLTFRLDKPSGMPAEDSARLFQQVIERVATLPGVESACLADAAPLSGTFDRSVIHDPIVHSSHERPLLRLPPVAEGCNLDVSWRVK